MDEEKMKQMKEDAERTEITIRELARMTGHPAAVYKVAQIDLQKKVRFNFFKYGKHKHK